MFKVAIIWLARLSLAVWMLLFAFAAFGSLLSYPWPFVLMAFVLAAMPYWTSLRPRQIFVVSALLTVVAAAVPVALLVSYGDSEGGVSGFSSVLRLSLGLGVLAYGLALLGFGLGRLVWTWPAPAPAPASN